MKRLILALVALLSWPWRLVPRGLRRRLLFGLMLLESRIGGPGAALGRLFALSDDLELLINERAMAYGAGEHPKHGLTRYHEFFVERIPAGATVLDIGCGYGAVARSIARRVEGAEVTGIDVNPARIREAEAADNPPNLRFLVGDAFRDLPAGPWHTVVLSNILEHMEERVDFLRRLVAAASPTQILIRVPLFERHWQVPMRRELGVGYFSDPTHYIEHSLEEFAAEIDAAGLEITERQTLWGEIWAVCRARG
ncbi:MAG: methyltransferase domain-containing protein [Proteobacteria bacterium]|nr:methyltransferase domain-containing protein [Pseudomonadota bacterium]